MADGHSIGHRLSVAFAGAIYVLLNHRVFIPMQDCFMPHGNRQWASAAGNYAHK